MTKTLAHCLEVCAAAVKPRRALTVSQWADEHIGQAIERQKRTVIKEG